ncbi:CSC1-like protein At1g10090 isoform X2 [Camellia sinensis]|uniref:CSC1-like protein At1g10090 isoform X2 n=1 Tax=Camellia sinensis TaxID=4442 RepID=UPI00103582A4|nr:CSC1-like protein At1g10090 isoform X2 [Camellia sinensis]
MDSNFLQATFFMTYILSSGWASLSFELLQPYALLCNLFYKFILRNKEDPCTLSFPYHTKIPRVLLLGFLGFTYSIMAPLILPFLPVYFFLAYLVYRNQVLIELDRKDELCGRMDEMYKKFPKAYSQFPSTSNDLCKDIPLSHCEDRDGNTRLQDLEDIKPGNLPIQSWMKTLFLGRFYSVHNFVANLQQMVLLRGLVDNIGVWRRIFTIM